MQMSKSQEIVRSIWTKALGTPVVGFVFMAVSWLWQISIGQAINNFPVLAWLMGFDAITVYLTYNFGALLWIVGLYLLPVTIALAIVDLIMVIANRSKNE